MLSVISWQMSVLSLAIFQILKPVEPSTVPTLRLLLKNTNNGWAAERLAMAKKEKSRPGLSGAAFY